MEQRTLDREKRIREIMKDIFKSKYGVDMEDSKLGKLIMNSYNFMTADQIDLDKILYNISFNDKDSVRITFTNYGEGVVKIITNSKGDVYDFNDDEMIKEIFDNEELKKEIANAIGVDKVPYILSWSRVDKNHMNITIPSVEYVVDIDKLEDFDCDKEYKELQDKADEYSKMKLEKNQEFER